MAFRDRHQRANGGPLGRVVQRLAAGVGLASESIQHHQEKKRLQTLEDETSAGGEGKMECGDSQQEIDRTMAPEHQDEAAWQLDDAQEELASQISIFKEADPSSVTTPNPADGRALAANFLHDHPPTYSESTPARRLELPVILTQRRPKTRTRGFIRAYAPVLEDVGIDQQTFLDFVDDLNKAVEPNPWIQAINLASLAAQHVPEPVTLAVSIACKMVADAAAETHSRTKTNGFLDSVNERFFKPRGLVAVIMTWKPTDSSMITNVDFDLGSTTARATPETSGSFAKLKHRMQSSHGASSFEFPETAPLIFPAIDELAASASGNSEMEAKKQNVFKRGGKFLTDYTDRRAVAQWATDNPQSNLANAAPKPEFRSRYADPAHPASSGDLLAFATGGKISRSSLRGGLGRGRTARREGRGSDSRGFALSSFMDDRMNSLEAQSFGRRFETRGYSQSNMSVSHEFYTSEFIPSESQYANGLYGARHDGMGRHRRAVGRTGVRGTGLGSLSPITGLRKLLQNVSVIKDFPSFHGTMRNPMFC